MKLLMTHGGLYSNQETVWNGVPLIGLPIFGDQVTIKKQNVISGPLIFDYCINKQVNYVVKAQKDGYALCLNWMTLTEDSLFNAIQEVITNPK